MSKNSSCTEYLHEEGTTRRTIFLLTRPQDSERTKLCFRLIEKSNNPVLYLAGDGVYNLLSGNLDFLAHERIYACKEDMEARGVVNPADAISLPCDFYGHFVKDVMLCSHRLYTF